MTSNNVVNSWATSVGVEVGNTLVSIAAGEQACCSGDEQQIASTRLMEDLTFVPPNRGTVSYTHLRAHETEADL
eukprot:78204-Amphidinium_carterae.1